MADALDAFKPPRDLPQWEDALPTLHADADRIIDLMTAALEADGASEGFNVFAACGGQGDGPWTPVVILELGETRWFVSSDTARVLAGRLRASRIAFDDPDQVAQVLHHYARQADLLATGALPSTPAKETRQ